MIVWVTFLYIRKKVTRSSLIKHFVTLFVLWKFQLLLVTMFLTSRKLKVPTVLEKSLNFWFSLKSPWIFGFPWKVLENEFVLEFRGHSLKFQLVVLDFLFCFILKWKFEWIQQIKRYKSQFPLPPQKKNKIGLALARSSLQVKYFSSSSCSYIILEQLLSFTSFPRNTYRYLCILCVSMYQSVFKNGQSLLLLWQLFF